jgi:hypothetical protein
MTATHKSEAIGKKDDTNSCNWHCHVASDWPSQASTAVPILKQPSEKHNQNTRLKAKDFLRGAKTVHAVHTSNDPTKEKVPIKRAM